MITTLDNATLKNCSKSSSTTCTFRFSPFFALSYHRSLIIFQRMSVMPFSMNNHAQLKVAVKAALNGDWHAAHNIAQEYSDVAANWIHAVLHKIEGDVFNSKYWYAKTAGKKYDDFSDTMAELRVIQNSLK